MDWKRLQAIECRVCGCLVVTFIFLFLGGWLLLPTFWPQDDGLTHPQRPMHHQKRDNVWLSTLEMQLNHSNPYTLNLWYRYAKYVAGNKTKCYVCSLMPMATHTPRTPTGVSDVPPDGNLWSTGGKVILSLFPSLGVGKVMLHLETVNYRLEEFAVSTVAALKGIKEELTGLRLMTLQKRLVLDQLTASSGGVCVLVGSTCCTWIPDNDGDGGSITQALANLTALRDSMLQDHVNSNDWFSQFFGTGWGSLLFWILTPVLIVLLLLSILSCCVVPLAKNFVSKMIAVQFLHYSPVSSDEPEHDRHDDEVELNLDTDEDTDV